MAVKVKNFQTHYDNLKVARGAPVEVIKASYKALCLKHHPDRNNSSPESTRIMAIINESYEVLADPERRRQHDQWIDEQIANNASMGAGSQSQTYSEADWQNWLNSKERERIYQERLRKEQLDKFKNDAGAAVDGLRNVNKNIVKPWINRKLRQALKVFYWCLGGAIVIAVIFLSYEAIERNNSVVYPNSSAQDTDGSIYYSDEVPAADLEAVTAAQDIAASLDVNNEYQPTVIVDNSAKEEMDAGIAAIAAAMGKGQGSTRVPAKYGASFDCNQASTVNEQLICDSPLLALEDIELARMIGEARNIVSDEPALNNRLRKQWNFREKNCADSDCLVNWYAYQKNIMQEIIDTGNVRAGL